MGWFTMTRLLILGAIAAALVIGVPLAVRHYDARQQKIGYDQRAEEDRVAAEEQTERIRELERAAETRYMATAAVREKYITRTVTEVRYAAQSLAACPVPEPLRVRLNAAASCARDDSAAACEPDGTVPVAR